MAKKGGKTASMPEYPTEYEVRSLPGRAALRTARFFAVVAAISLFVNVSMVGALIGLTPLKEVRPFMVQFEQKSDVVTTVRPVQKEVEGFPLLVESLVRKYVLRREAIPRTRDEQDDILEQRWGEGSFVQLASAGPVYERFAQQSIELVQVIRENGIRRGISINSVSVLEPLKMYQVEFVATLYAPDESVRQRQTLEATIEISFNQQESLTRREALNNPTGFTVTSYNRAQKAGQ